MATENPAPRDAVWVDDGHEGGGEIVEVSIPDGTKTKWTTTNLSSENDLRGPAAYSGLPKDLDQVTWKDFPSHNGKEILFFNTADTSKEFRCNVGTRACAPSHLIEYASRALSLPPNSAVGWNEWDSNTSRLFGYIFTDQESVLKSVVIVDGVSGRTQQLSDLSKWPGEFNWTLYIPGRILSPSFSKLAILKTSLSRPDATLLIFRTDDLLARPQVIPVRAERDDATLEVAAWSRDESMTALTSRTRLYIVDLRTAKMTQRYHDMTPASYREPFDNGNVAFSSGGRYIVLTDYSGDDDVLTAIDLQSRVPAKQLFKNSLLITLIPGNWSKGVEWKVGAKGQRGKPPPKQKPPESVGQKSRPILDPDGACGIENACYRRPPGSGFRCRPDGVFDGKGQRWCTCDKVCQVHIQ